MKNKKLNLDELKVKSFVTDLEEVKLRTAKGGGTLHSLGCPTGIFAVGSCDRHCFNEG